MHHWWEPAQAYDEPQPGFACRHVELSTQSCGAGVLWTHLPVDVELPSSSTIWTPLQPFSSSNMVDASEIKTLFGHSSGFSMVDSNMSVLPSIVITVNT